MRTLRILTAVFAVSLLAGASYKPKLKPFQLDAVDFRLPSGLRVVFQQDNSAPSVFVVSYVDVGSSQEPVGKEGMAHLVEHLCFRAEHPGKLAVWDQISHMGAGYFNATTSNDRTNYFTMAPKDQLINLLEIEAARMLNPIEGVTEANVKTEREVVRNELRLGYENGTGKLWQEAFTMLYPKDHPYGRDTIGTHTSLDSITLADIQAFVKKYYVPENFTIVVAGDFDRAQANQILAKAFPRSTVVKPGTPADAKIAMIDAVVRVKGAQLQPPPIQDKGPRTIKVPVSNPVVVLAWSLPSGFREDQALMEVTAETMNSAIYSLLAPDTSDEKDRKVDGIGCGIDAARYGSTVFCTIELTEGQVPEKIAKKAIDGLWELWNADNVDGIEVSDGEETFKLPGQRRLFEVAKGEKQAALFRNAGSLGRADPVAEYMHYTGKPDFFTSRINEYSTITAIQSRELAYKFLNRDRVVTVILLPEDAKAKTGSSVAADAGASWAGATYGASTKGATDYSKITGADVEKLAVAPDVTTVKELTLPNGLKVYLKKHGTMPFVNVGLYTHGSGETVTPWGFPAFGSITWDAQDPGKVAGAWANSAFADGTLRGVETPSGNLLEALDLVSDRVTTTRSLWTRRAFDRGVERIETARKTAEKLPDIWQARAMANLLIPNHPFGTQDYDIKAIEKLGAKDYEAWVKKSVSPKNSALFVVGDIDLADAEKKVTQIFGKWRVKDPGERMPGFAPAPPKPARQIAMIDDAERTQAVVTVGCQVTKPTVENDAARDVFLQLLGEDIWNAIRIRAGASYGVRPYFQTSADGAVSLLYVAGSIQNDKTTPALKTILDRIGEIRAGKVDAVKLTETKWMVASGTRSENQSNGGMMSTLVGSFRREQPLATLSSYPQRLSKVTVADLQAILEPCAAHEVVTIIGPEKTLKTPLETLKIPIELVDWRKGSDATPHVDTKASLDPPK